MGIFSRKPSSAGSKQIKCQYKIDRYANACKNNSSMDEIQQAAEDLIDEYLWYYSQQNIEWNECYAIMDVFDQYAMCYNGKKYPQYSGLLCEDVIRELRRGMK